MRVIGLLRADQDTEGGAPPSADLMARMGEFMEEVTKAGIMVATDGLKPSSEGKRVKLTNGKVTVTDGPFTESKELIASYAVMDVKSMDEAVHWSRRFLEVLGQGELEIRPIFEASDFASDIFPPEAAAREEAMRAEWQKNATKS